MRLARRLRSLLTGLAVVVAATGTVAALTVGYVSVGQPIALVDNKGASTWPHLHVEVRIDDRTVEPERWLAEHGAALG